MSTIIIRIKHYYQYKNSVRKLTRSRTGGCSINRYELSGNQPTSHGNTVPSVHLLLPALYARNLPQEIIMGVHDLAEDFQSHSLHARSGKTGSNLSAHL